MTTSAGAASDAEARVARLQARLSEALAHVKTLRVELDEAQQLNTPVPLNSESERQLGASCMWLSMTWEMDFF